MATKGSEVPQKKQASKKKTTLEKQKLTSIQLAEKADRVSDEKFKNIQFPVMQKNHSNQVICKA
ncbi:hypothetical protein BCR25_01765 [Enterococcus termitis]|uniref:Uncharacterized protein n=1 Tax=Enterococcus termitis TaxID=332950 RepID=A0A1E5H6J2_9ENTE|nr:hypothetical protein BCR25_01765 [Enterococcus termitis]OJG99869.1 hypothetical protein RV18_GL000208 [Enterococcus termitis]